MALHETLREDLARFETAARAIRPEDREPGVAQAVADARSDRRFGAQNDEIDAFGQGALRQGA